MEEGGEEGGGGREKGKSEGQGAVTGRGDGRKEEGKEGGREGGREGNIQLQKSCIFSHLCRNDRTSRKQQSIHLSDTLIGLVKVK